MRDTKTYDTELIAAASAVREKAYAPYSKFKVGAAVRAKNGKIYTGCNVENAAYPVGLCAEKNAVSSMIADGQTVITAVAVSGSTEGICSPCGNCRQFISEFAAPDVPVYVSADCMMTLAELLPHSFGPMSMQNIKN